MLCLQLTVFSLLGYLYFTMAEIDMAEFEGAGERYKFLIQPVKDLAANWDLDIAKTLEDYIRKVVEDTNRFDADFPADEHRQHKVFNFAEAALLIHGTTTVYARKVEYVLQRAQSFFDQLREDENIHQQQQRGKRRKANDTLEQGAQGEEEGTDENGNANDAAGVQERRQPKISYASLGHLLDRLSRRRSSLLPFVPIAFFPFTDFEKKDVSLRTRTDPTEVFGKKEDFRLNSCHIHGSVALLDFKNISIINKFSQLAINSQKKDANFVALEPLMEQTEDDFNDALSCGAESTADTLQRQTNQQQETERRGTGASAPTQLRQIDFVAEEIINLPQDEVWDNELEQTDHQKLQNIPQLEFLDPYQRITDQSQPLRRKQNCVMNAIKQITARTHRIKRDCLEKGVPNVSTIKCYIETRIFRRQLKKRAYTLGLFNSFIADQAVLALNPLIHEEEKRRSELRKKRRKEIQNAERVERFMRRAMQDREVDPVLEHPAGSDEEQADDEGDAEQIQDDGEIDEFDDPMDELVAEEIINLPQDEVWDNELEQNDHQNLGDILEVEDLENSFGRMQNLYAGFEHLNTLQRKRAKSLVAQCNFSDDTIFAGGVINSDDLPPRPISQMDYDEIIAFHLRKYWTASEQVTSAFSERIQKWEKRMTEVLEQEHLRREFCTSIYGDELLERFGGQINSELDFTKMLAELPNDYDRSRFLLVALILANMGNVHILTDEDDGEKQIIRLRLLSLKKQEFSL